MSTITSFEFEGQMFQWVETDKGFAVRADEMCERLGWNKKDVSRIIQTKIFKDYRFQSSFGNVGKPAWYLYEPGVWQLLFSSNNELAEKLQRWVFEEVLPKLRASGGYIMPNATSDQVKALLIEHQDRLIQSACMIEYTSKQIWEKLEIKVLRIVWSEKLTLKERKQFNMFAYALQDLMTEFVCQEEEIEALKLKPFFLKWNDYKTVSMYGHHWVTAIQKMIDLKQIEVNNRRWSEFKELTALPVIQ